MKYNNEDITKLGTILTIWAHPDDESWCAAGIMATAVQNGQRVVCVTATRGDAGETADEKRWPQANLSKIRTLELTAALETLGVKEHHWLDFKDGELKLANEAKAVKNIVNLIEQIKPDTLLTFGPDGLTGHTDHCKICEWVIEAVTTTQSNTAVYGVIETEERFKNARPGFLKKSQIFFNSKEPKTISAKEADLYFELPITTKNLKRQALKAHACQLSGMFNLPGGSDYLSMLCDHECFMRLKT